MSNRTLTVHNINIEIDGGEPEVIECMSAREADKEIAGIVADFKAGGYREVTYTGKKPDGLRLEKLNGHDEASEINIWVELTTEYAD